jgi:hypothetical protein
MRVPGEPTGDQIALAMLVVQPVQLSGKVLDRAFTGTMDLDSTSLVTAFEPPAPPPCPPWASSWTRWGTGPSFSSSFLSTFRVVAAQIGVRTEQLRQDILTHYRGPDPAQLAEALRWSETRLLVDVRLNAFVLVHEVTFVVPGEEMLSALLTPTNASVPGGDLYNQLRGLFVADHAMGVTPLPEGASAYVRDINDAARQAVGAVVAGALGVQPDQGDITIPCSSGNVSFIVRTGENRPASAALRDQLHASNAAAEAVTRRVKRLDLADQEMCVFGGRFHSICVSSLGRQWRFMLIQFHMQYFWFMVHQLQGMIQRAQTELVTRQTKAHRPDPSPMASALILKSQLLTAHREALKTKLETDAEAVYAEIQGQWSIDDGIAQLAQSTTFLRDYFVQQEAQARSTSSDRISILLLFISLLQLFGLISFWNDYLALTKPGSVDAASPVTVMLGGKELLYRLNLALPVIVATIAFLGLLMVYLRWNRKR